MSTLMHTPKSVAMAQFNDCEKVVFPPRTIGWLMNIADVYTPHRKLRKVYLEAGFVNRSGQMLVGFFTIKGARYYLNMYREVVTVGGRPMQSRVEVWVNRKFWLDKREREFAEWASTPGSETYMSA